jgi:hypothetical protein
MANDVKSIKPRRTTKLKTPIRGRVYDVLRDVPDIRDRIYEPTLSPLPYHLPLPTPLHILDQGKEGACTGFALAATVNLLLRKNPAAAKQAAAQRRRVSPHMLYTMARRHDEWPGDKYDGSSLRGALRGFYNNGACSESLWRTTKMGDLTIEAAKDARRTALGAYYRLRPALSDYHAAITETGVIYASAAVHAGWDRPVKGRIEPKAGAQLHAFAIVGYDDEGFWIQNSWGSRWGNGGLAHWAYKDWAANIQDAWVLQLAIPAPSAFDLGIKRDRTTSATDLSGAKRAAPARKDIAGHFVHVENGDFSATQPYTSNRADVAETAELLATSDKYSALLFYAHGGLNAPEQAAIRTAAMTEVFMVNGIYPYSVLYDTGLLATLKDIITGKGAAITERAGGFLDLTDDLIEKAIGGIGKKLWNEMKGDASRPFDPGRDGETALRLFAQHLQGGHLPIHLVGHSTGAILIGRLLAALDRIVPGGMTVASCSLMAPACSIDFYRRMFKPRLGPGATAAVKIGKMTVYCLDDQAEQDDEVTRFYNKSLLYLVSNAFEQEPQTPLLGMAKFHAKAKLANDPLKVWYAASKDVPTASMSHGGFDNDPRTMNDILQTVLGKKPGRPFSVQDLDF